MPNFGSYILYLLLLTICYSAFGFTLDIKNKYVLFDFYFAKFNFLRFISTPSNRSPTCVWFYLRYKIRIIIQSSVLSFSDVLKVANFLLPSLCSVFLVLLGRTPVVRIFSTNYAKFFCLFLWLCINVLHDVGECCESVPLGRTGSYVCISINITTILACVVQVDAFIISL